MRIDNKLTLSIVPCPRHFVVLADKVDVYDRDRIERVFCGLDSSGVAAIGSSR